MDKYLYTDTEFLLSRERNRKYFGAAKIKLRQIIPHPSISTGPDSHNVDRLCEIFRKDRCRRLDVQNHVTAVVAGRHLREALEEELTTETLMTNNLRGEYPMLDFGTTTYYVCMVNIASRRRRKSSTPATNDISPDLQATLVDDYSNERTPTDGEVYRKVRQYQYESNARLEGRWMARLSSNKAKRLRQLSSHPTVRAGFDSLLAIPALLLHGMILGSLPRALAADIPEEMVTGLQNLKEYWSSIFKGDRGKMLRLDVYTVEKIPLLAPGLSTKETRTVQGLVLSGEVFSNFSEPERSLDKYAATVKNALFATFEWSNSGCLVQISEKHLRQCSTSPDDSKELAYRQLWLYAIRHYLKLGKEPEDDNLIAKQSCEEADQRCLRDMALLARKLGFRSPKIENLINQSPDHQIARAALLKAREPYRFRYENSSFDHLVRRILDCFQEAVSVDAEPAPKCKEEEAHVRVRCGFPRRKALQFDRSLLFLDKMHGRGTSEARAISPQHSPLTEGDENQECPTIDGHQRNSGERQVASPGHIFLKEGQADRREVQLDNQSITSDEEMEDSDGDWSSKGAETDNGATVLERDLEAELDRLQRDAGVRKKMDAAQEVPRMDYHQQSPGGLQQRIPPHDTVMDDVQTARTEQSADNSTDERVSPAETSAVNPARTGRPLTRFDFGQADPVLQCGSDAHHQQPLEMVVPRSGIAVRESISARAVSPAKNIPDQSEAAMSQGPESDVGHTKEERNRRPVTRILVEMAEQQSGERTTLDFEQPPMQAAWNAKASPMPPVISSREALEGLSDEESSEEQDEAAMLSTPDPAARETAAAKLDGRSPGLPPEAGSSHMPAGPCGCQLAERRPRGFESHGLRASLAARLVAAVQ
ncbi:hypothetical protein FE257_004124 [Aspergillus nanangensis]|uniref:Uncharacterized protein n=1 Tax=Aspergillus nanangensis TaxID=2582783 RepID=A0AAD4CC43_ASPNN|nr:hypothetical protein FE257_004124 [Aspergillus nanangensis]